MIWLHICRLCMQVHTEVTNTIYFKAVQDHISQLVAITVLQGITQGPR